MLSTVCTSDFWITRGDSGGKEGSQESNLNDN